MPLPPKDPDRRRGAAPRRRHARTAALFAVACLAGASAAAESLRIAASRAPVSLPLYVALQRGFFREAGLEVEIEDCIGGQRCLRRMLEGKADVATSGEMPIVLRSFERGDLAVIATITDASDNLKLIARKASGIVQSRQLDGKRVGVITGTASQYVLETHLLAVGVDPRKVTMVPMQPEDAEAALRAARIDAVAVWEPFGYAALHGDAPVGVRLPLADGYIETYNLVADRALFGVRDAALVKLLRAVERAETFIQAEPAEAQAILMQRLGLDRGFIDWVWRGLAFRMSLDQSLLTTMESEARWAQREGHVEPGARINVLTLVYPGPLKAVKPTAVGTGN
jgi:ABC-type nitrate/sulfonate/bicarbonate transport system substrate-binding protein